MKKIIFSKEILLSFLLSFLCIFATYSVEIDTTKFGKVNKHKAAFRAIIWSYDSQDKYAIIDKDGKRDTVFVNDEDTLVPFEEERYKITMIFPSLGNYICFDTSAVNTNNVITLNTFRQNLELIIFGDVVNFDIKHWYAYIEAIDLSRSQSIKEFVFHSAYLIKIYINGAKNLRICNIVNDDPGSWEIKDYPNLMDLYCNFTKIINLNIGDAPLLKDLDCDSNEIQELDLSVCPNLEKLDCSINPLTKLTFQTSYPWNT